MYVFTVQVMKKNSRSRALLERKRKDFAISWSFINYPDSFGLRNAGEFECTAAASWKWSQERCVPFELVVPRCDEGMMRAAIRSFSGFRWQMSRGFGARWQWWHVDNRGESRATSSPTSTAASVSIRGGQIPRSFSASPPPRVPRWSAAETSPTVTWPWLASFFFPAPHLPAERRLHKHVDSHRASTDRRGSVVSPRLFSLVTLRSEIVHRFELYRDRERDIERRTPERASPSHVTRCLLRWQSTYMGRGLARARILLNKVSLCV